jgi:hypothetical protein
MGKARGAGAGASRCHSPPALTSEIYGPPPPLQQLTFESFIENVHLAFKLNQIWLLTTCHLQIPFTIGLFLLTF